MGRRGKTEKVSVTLPGRVRRVGVARRNPPSVSQASFQAMLPLLIATRGPVGSFHFTHPTTQSE